MINWTGLNQDNKVKILIVIIGALLSGLGYFAKDIYTSVSAAASDKSTQQAEPNPAGNVVEVGSVNTGGRSPVNIGGGTRAVNDYSSQTDNSNNPKLISWIVARASKGLKLE
ncbi:MAG: hypothetical protein KTR17_09755 [Cellvibrionaceae bacterium]|nr:hypothetical protein [Cellvibrionaceae bacterium]